MKIDIWLIIIRVLTFCLAVYAGFMLNAKYHEKQCNEFIYETYIKGIDYNNFLNEHNIKNPKLLPFNYTLDFNLSNS